jgi:hypothetical protein
MKVYNRCQCQSLCKPQVGVPQISSSKRKCANLRTKLKKKICGPSANVTICGFVIGPNYFADLKTSQIRKYMAGGSVRQPFAGVDFIPQSGIHEFGYRISKGGRSKLAMSNQRSFKIGSFRFAAFVPKKIECRGF